MGRYDNRINLDEIDNVENKSLKMQIGEWYDSEDNIHTDKTRKAYETIARINNIWFELIPIPVIFQEEDPYSNYTELKETVEQEGVLVFLMVEVLQRTYRKKIIYEVELSMIGLGICKRIAISVLKENGRNSTM